MCKVQALRVWDVGSRFTDYYASQAYGVIPGSSLLDPSVPMTFVMSAGLVQVETSARLQGGRTGSRYALLQNCFRYFDMTKVGASATHLSLFQMPGAFTFGPLSKRESIAQIWRLLTEVYCFQAESLWVTYFAGGQVAGCEFQSDWETARAWREMGLPPEHIVALGADSNFWKQGGSVVGKAHAPKCGPNTEVFFDRGDYLRCGPACRPGCDCGRFVEFLNTLFITLHIDEQRDIVKPLEEPFTETVVGAERVAMLLQEAPSVFEIDSIRPLVDHVRLFSKVSRPVISDRSRHERIIADHVRAILFLTADGAPRPGRGGRARLMRKLVREMLTGQKLLEIADSSFVPSLMQLALSLYVDQQPHLARSCTRAIERVEVERNRFERTLESGRRNLDRILTQRADCEFGPEDIRNMEKRHGVPPALLETMLIQCDARFSRQDHQTLAQRRQLVAGTRLRVMASPGEPGR
jgi:alanyl-tRNA synthetase